MATESFIPVVENVSGLQSSDDEKGRLFRDIAVQGHMKDRSRPGVSHQGIYTFTADGQSLGSGNPLEAEKTLTLLREALSNWEQLEAGDEKALQFKPDEDSYGYPEDGAVLRLTARDLPRSNGPAYAEGQERFARTWNNDFLWLSPSDVRALIPGSLTVGIIHEVPHALLHRVARFHLRDIVRGEPGVWGPDAVEHITLMAEVVRRDGNSVTLVYNGHVVLEEHGDFRDSHKPIDWAFDNSLDAAIIGEAVWNDVSGSFERFDLLVAGQRAGAHRYNARTHDPGPAPIGFSMELAGDSAWERTPPHVIRTWTRAGQAMPPVPTTVSGEPYYGAS